jgi:hypothetical protein
MKTNKYLQIIALFLTASLSALAAQERETPFRGTIQFSEAWDTQFPTLLVTGTGSGEGTQLGSFTVTYAAEVNLVTAAGSGAATFTAANGDRLMATIIGQASPTQDPLVSALVESYTITEGTGRFAGATGSFTVRRLLSTITGLSSGLFEGSILIPTAHKAHSGPRG